MEKQSRYVRNFSHSMGFTLIELLVVVLIIGILASIAVPKYQKAVTKSRYASLKHIVRGVSEAVNVYHMANGTYPDGFDVLSVESGGEQRPTRTYQRYPWGQCTMEPTNQYVFCKNDSIHMSYLEYLDGKRVCVVYDNNALAHELCKQETSTSSPWKSTNWYKYKK